MKKSSMLGALCAAVISVISLSSQAALIGVLPATSGGTDWQAYYDDQLDISWTANANINSVGTWDTRVAWAASLMIDGIGGWRLPSMDVNGNGTIVNCASGSQAACKDNEYGHLYYYGEGTTLGNGITPASPGPFSNLDPFAAVYWSGTENAIPGRAWRFNFEDGVNTAEFKESFDFAWAVHAGNVGVVPVPGAVWLFSSGLLGLISMARRK